MCRVVSKVFTMTSTFTKQKLVLALIHFYTPSPNLQLLLQGISNYILQHFSPYKEKGHLFFGVSFTKSLGLHRTVPTSTHKH